MLKKFFISMLGTMAGLWLSFFFLIVIGIFAIGALVAKSATQSKSVSDNSILYINLAGEIPERQVELNFQDVLNSSELGGDSFVDIVDAIRAAASDKKIKGIYINLDGAGLGVASRSEVREALSAFKQSGKWVYAYGDNIGQGDYYVAADADAIYLNPVGNVDVHGLVSQVLFFKNLLDKVGVKMQVIKVGSYKSAVEPFLRTSMSEPSREQTTVYLTQIWNMMAGEIAADRHVTEADVNLWADSLSMTWAPERYVDNRIVTELKYRTEFEDMLREKVGKDNDEELPLITPTEYMAEKSMRMLPGKGKHVAVYYAVGDIVDEGRGGIVGPKVVDDLVKITQDDDVAGLVLRVNSGGGSAFASEQIWHAIQNFKATGRPVYVSMGDYAASGGYYISCGADSIFADAATLTGSIGIFGLIPDASDLITNKIGINIETVETNKDAAIAAVFQPMTPRQYDAMQSYIERGYDTFTKRVAEGRGISQDSVKVIGGGRVWDGLTALNIGLVDHIGSLHHTINAMTSALGLKSDKYVNYPEIDNDWFALLMQTGIVKIDDSTGRAIRQVRDMEEWRAYFMEQPMMQARMEAITIE